MGRVDVNGKGVSADMEHDRTCNLAASGSACSGPSFLLDRSSDVVFSSFSYDGWETDTQGMFEPALLDEQNTFAKAGMSASHAKPMSLPRTSIEVIDVLVCMKINKDLRLVTGGGVRGCGGGSLGVRRAERR